MKHLNGHRLVAIHAITSGEVPRYHDLIELGAVALGPDLKPDRSILPLQMVIQPAHPATAVHLPRARKLEIRAGLAPDLAAVGFCRWYDSLGLKINKRIIPVCCHWQRQWPFLIDWLCEADGKAFAYDHFHDRQVRDLCTLNAYWNDLAWWTNNVYPFPKDYAQNYARRLGTSWVSNPSAVARAAAYAEIYAAISKVYMPQGLPLRLETPREEEFARRMEDQPIEDEEE